MVVGKKGKVAFFVGRFQPFHKGHLFAIKHALKKFDKVVIGIGSINVIDEKNPFTFEERKRMIKEVLKNFKGKYKIVGIPDFFDDVKWRSYCLEKARFDVVITGSSWVKRCFKGIKPVIKPKFLKPKKYNGTRIRELIGKNKKWENLVPEPVAKYIKKIKGEERIKKLIG
jgi:nicotinamide-nucleotide adenylyltransferase